MSEPRDFLDDEVPPVGCQTTPLRRRAVLTGLAGLGLGTATFQRALAAQAAADGAVSTEMVKQAEWIAGIEFNDDERQSIARSAKQSLQRFRDLRKVEVGYDVAPALTFFPVPPRPTEGVRRNQATPVESRAGKRPDNDEALAFLPVTELAPLLRSGAVTSTELTRLSLARFKKYDPLLKCVVNLTEKTALEQAARADAEIAAGRYRGPLHGIPWGAKDLIAYPGYPTTWGAPQFKERVIDVKATVAAHLEEAGAVLVAKLSLGTLAQGDQWFGGRTNSPWDPRLGSSGSSAGSASAVAAGLVGFAIGSETLGSIVSPCRACGASGLRPTFGRVARTGCMTLSWSMDKLGPIALPEDLPAQAITLMLGTEAAAAFDDLTRQHISEGLNSWPATFRVGQFTPAVEYLRAARVRAKLMAAMAEVMELVDVYVGSGLDLPITNLTGHPSVVFPFGFTENRGRKKPGSVTLTGRLFDESTLLAVARALQESRGDHLQRPPLDRYLAEQDG